MTHNLFYSAVLFTILIISIDGAINCFYGIEETAPGVHISNIVKTSCPSDFFCFKQSKIDKKSKHYEYSYDCGTIQICSQPTCVNEDDGFRTCCCTTDFCNSSDVPLSIFSSLLLFVLIFMNIH
ncbi:Activin_recp domain-containing protein [Caenorhabditis elegans]|uniref:Activin_recp domain-containing protein n=1 Tax=Caenorhabditis elegans TaxID=6239 RepID=A0A2C9C3A5_CAEEL|nr:Activin_recp domain-containing protein [Caenorhabditis elegans]pir/T34307/ hypothetical protein F55C12.3 - Caenorhabditis elegans [Caenorhabditis elegans]SOF58763.1 Activin_recp domain-containing protein [Caenorhabditis elegans]|eukprot:NP_001343771.1 Uncharacterized protein CELE_F55C12.19 [Caenorhabditis elegans]